MPHLSGIVDNLIKSDVSTVLNVFLLLSVSWPSRALMIREEAEGITSIWACLFWIVSFIVILRPFQSPVALAMSSPTFFGDRPRGPILGARADVATTSPLVHLRYMTLILLGSNLGGMVEAAGVGWNQIQDDWRKLHLGLLRAKSQKLFLFLIFSVPQSRQFFRYISGSQILSSDESNRIFISSSEF